MKIIPIDYSTYEGKKVRVYRNLANGLMSIQMYTKGKGWLVVGHSEDLAIKAPTFLVGESVRQQVIAKKRKRVHAYIEGTLVNPDKVEPKTLLPVSYNPYKAGYFYYVQSESPVNKTDLAVILNTKVFVEA